MRSDKVLSRRRSRRPMYNPCTTHPEGPGATIGADSLIFTGLCAHTAMSGLQSGLQPNGRAPNQKKRGKKRRKQGGYSPAQGTVPQKESEHILGGEPARGWFNEKKSIPRFASRLAHQPIRDSEPPGNSKHCRRRPCQCSVVCVGRRPPPRRRAT